MEKNTPNYNTKYSKLTAFKNYVPDKEKEELKKLKRQKLKNPEDVYDLANNKQMKFNNVSKTMQSLSSDEIADKLKAAEGIDEEFDMAFGNIPDVDTFIANLKKDILDHKEDIRLIMGKNRPADVDSFNKVGLIERHLDEILKIISR